MKARNNRHIGTHKTRGEYKSNKYLLRSALCSPLLRPCERIQTISETGLPFHRVSIQLEFSLTPQWENNGSKFLSGMLWVHGVSCASCVLLERCCSSSLKEKRSCYLPDVRLLSPLKLYLQRRDSPFQVLLSTDSYSIWSELMQKSQSVMSHLESSEQRAPLSTSAVPPFHTPDANTSSQDTSLHLLTSVARQYLPGRTVRPKAHFPLLL